MNDRPDLQLITQIARLYYEERLTQNQIADRLGMSQVSVSRFLRPRSQYVRTTAIQPVEHSLIYLKFLPILIPPRFGRVHPQRHRGHRGTFFGKNGEVRSR